MRFDVPLAPFTSLSVGGMAEKLMVCDTYELVRTTLNGAAENDVWVLGYGANVLIADEGLPGTTILMRTQQMSRKESTIIVDAGVWWDNLVQFSIGEQLWGIELMSAIPGGVGAAIVGNIAAYGQAIADTLAWVEVLDRATNETRRLLAADLHLSYRFSAFQEKEFSQYIIIRAAFTLHTQPVKQVEYQAALDVAQMNGYDLQTLKGRRQAVLDTRKAAGSLWDYRSPDTQMHTAGSFFRNPLVSDEIAERLMSFDETGRTAESLQLMNKIHGGTGKRVSAAHVLLAAGFNRGQAWGPVRLHPDHILKIENTGGATAQQIYSVSQEIVRTVKTSLDIDLIPEVRFLGNFKEASS